MLDSHLLLDYKIALVAKNASFFFHLQLERGLLYFQMGKELVTVIYFFVTSRLGFSNIIYLQLIMKANHKVQLAMHK